MSKSGKRAASEGTSERIFFVAMKKNEMSHSDTNLRRSFEVVWMIILLARPFLLRRGRVQRPV